MRPILSTRLFGRLPDSRTLAFARRHGFVALAVALDDVPASSSEARMLRARLDAEGLSAPAVHLPTRLGERQLLDLHAVSPVDRTEASERLRGALDDAQALGAEIAVIHASARPSPELFRLLEEADARDVGLCFEQETLPGTGLAEILAFLGSLGDDLRAHGLCLDLARTRPSQPMIARLHPTLRWLEVSGHPDDRRHLTPLADDDLLLETVQQLAPGTVCYEVVPSGPAGRRPGDAELTNLLRILSAWHRGGGQTSYQWPSPP